VDFQVDPPAAVLAARRAQNSGRRGADGFILDRSHDMRRQPDGGLPRSLPLSFETSSRPTTCRVTARPEEQHERVPFFGRNSTGFQQGLPLLGDITPLATSTGLDQVPFSQRDSQIPTSASPSSVPGEPSRQQLSGALWTIVEAWHPGRRPAFQREKSTSAWTTAFCGGGLSVRPHASRPAPEKHDQSKK